MNAERSDVADLEAWREAWRQGTTPATGCPGDQALAALATGELAGEERLRLADHLVSCPACAASWRLLREIDAAAADARPTAAPPARRRTRSWLAAGAAVAAVLGAFAVGTVLERRAEVPRETPTMRGIPALGRPLAPPHGAVLSAPPENLSWSGPEGATRWRVWVYDAESVPLWTSAPTAAGQVELPARLRQRLAAGGTFYWRVRTEDGPASRDTPLARFEIAR